ncbi:hypothetical protein J5X84_15830 [Streptosporangiaceae bacterium NEAU-GS5]|nr:hypothetical protein [Streptosporangiaceae bacterium NEAU-GS5]
MPGFHSTISKAALAVGILAAGVVMTTQSDAPAPDAKAFTACMRSHNLPDFPEVSFSSEGLVNLDIEGERVDALSEKYGAAVKACESLLPADARLPAAPEAPSAPSLPS